MIERPIILAERLNKNDIIISNRKTIILWIDSAISHTKNPSIIKQLKKLRYTISGDIELNRLISDWRCIKETILEINTKNKSLTKRQHRISTRDDIQYDIDIDVQFVKGVGEKRAKLLNQLGIETVRDLLYYFPRDYQDRTKIMRFNEISEGEHITAFGRIIDVSKKEIKGQRMIISALVSDGHGSVEIIWWGMPYLYNKLGRGEMILISGKPTIYNGRFQFFNPEFELGEDFDGVNYGRIVPIYPLTKGIFQKNIRRIIHYALKTYLPKIIDFIPQEILIKEDLPDIREALSNIHFPTDISLVDRSKKRLIFESLFLIQIEVLRRRYKFKQRLGLSFISVERLKEEYLNSLPFKPTSAQIRTFNEIRDDLISERQMMRLLQGDVGSGKTLVAVLSSLIVIEAGYQVAIMAPTEILARQHYKKISRELNKLNLNAYLIVGEQCESERRLALSAAKQGKNSIFIGTHALIQEGVEFSRLGLVIIDEQHRFGVHQRATLITKGEGVNLLVMTATPIPRTLALTLYGDLDLSVIDEMPPGRGKRETIIINEDEREMLSEIIKNTLVNNDKVFIVYPLVQESEKVDLKAATDAFRKIWFPKFSEFGIALLHGKMSKEEQRRVMEEFEEGSINLLITTTVAEVGIDISSANLMVVECADRFGLAQLHQLRGRIGRGKKKASFILVKRENITEIAQQRLKVLTETDDGFVIAEEDLKLRGPGEYLGTRQSGIPDRLLLAVMNEPELLNIAKRYADEFLNKDPDLTSREGILVKEVSENIYGDRLHLTIP
ncbi:MAG: ATP-dependent DNA helicase RecG [bacterium]